MISPTSAKNVVRMIYMLSTHYNPDYHQGSPRQRGWFFTHIPQALSPSSEAILLFLPTSLFIHGWCYLGGTKCNRQVPSHLSTFHLRWKAIETLSFCVLCLLNTIMANLWQGLYSSDSLDMEPEIRSLTDLIMDLTFYGFSFPYPLTHFLIF